MIAYENARTITTRVEMEEHANGLIAVRLGAANEFTLMFHTPEEFARWRDAVAALRLPEREPAPLADCDPDAPKPSEAGERDRWAGDLDSDGCGGR